jgi:penicillin-binding protein 2
MFQRRLRAFLFFLVLITGLLGLRAAQIQWLQRDAWRSQATELMKQWELVDTTRGAILDRNGKVLAFDAPCIDACVDYRAIGEDPDPAWLRKHAISVLLNQMSDTGQHIAKASALSSVAIDQEVLREKGDITDMWGMIAKVSGKSPDEIDDIRRSIVQRVEMRRRWIWWRTYAQAVRGAGHASWSDWYKDILSNSAGSADIDQYEATVAEQESSHVILHAVDPQTQAILARDQERFFPLSLRPSKHREYPYGRVACHIVGHLGEATAEETGANDPNADDELRHYRPSDLVGRTGAEALCETSLRGARGRIEKLVGSDVTLSNIDPIPGKDVKLSIDVDLQADIEQAFVQQRTYGTGENAETRFNQHGAAVVIDIATGQVLAMASNPGFDPNTLDATYTQLARDDLNLPLINRATQMALEPGSTVKTIVGCGSITHGFMTPTSTVECTGYLVLRGHKYSVGRCWVVKTFEAHPGVVASPAHHPFPLEAPHPTGFLTVSDGLERSCNVVFETIADKMGMRELSYWYDQFGLGRKTGIGLEESAGMIPDPVDASIHSPLRMLTWFAGIGQGHVQATPLQMANVAATISRGGIWVRPELVAEEDVGRAGSRSAADMGPDRVDLHLTPEAVAAVQEGMRRVVNTQAGTGRGILPEEQQPPIEDDPLSRIVIAGKTGSAQTALMQIPQRDADGTMIYQDGHVLRKPVELGSPGTEGWYAGAGLTKQMVHAWYIGYAPADHPKVAFAVMVEYGEAGGTVAGSIAHDVLEACVRHGYLASSR